MTYQELIKCYPWIDLAWEVFKGISPTCVALVTIFLTEYFVRRRSDVYKRQEMKLRYLEEILSWLHETRRNVFEIMDALGKVLAKSPAERNDGCNEIIKKISEMNKDVFVRSDTYIDITKGFGYDFKLEQFKEAVIVYSEKMNSVMIEYHDLPNTEQSIDEMNLIMEEVRTKMQESVTLLVEKINLLYKK